MISFQKKVYQVARKIPKGKTLTYKEIAKKAGLPKAWRVVGKTYRIPPPSKAKIQ